jgi:small subunit ribosomal protein S4
MAKYNGPVCRLCRREGMKLFLKGTRCYSKKCSFERRATPPGQHGVRRRKMSDFGTQLREKQKIRRVYQVMERQFRRYFDVAETRPGVTGENLLRLLETRLDNVVFRAGFAKSRDMARQLVTHGHFTVNGRKVNIPSYRVSANDIVEVRAGSREMTPFVVAHAEIGERTVPAWLEVIPSQMRILVHTLPVRGNIDTQVNEQLIVELYSK